MGRTWASVWHQQIVGSSPGSSCEPQFPHLSREGKDVAFLVQTLSRAWHTVGTMRAMLPPLTRTHICNMVTFTKLLPNPHVICVSYTIRGLIPVPLYR